LKDYTSEKGLLWYYFIQSTKLLYTWPGYYLDGWLPAGR